MMLCMLVAGPAAAELTGLVVGVSAGDTVTLKVDERVLELRLGDIDAPEAGQPFDLRAALSLAEVCLLKEATVEALGIDKPRGVFGRIACNGVDAAAEQVRRGMAWVAHERAPDAHLHPLQAEARAARRGLWSDTAPVPPWQWSAGHVPVDAN